MAATYKILAFRSIANARLAFRAEGTIGVVAAETYKDEYSIAQCATQHTTGETKQ